MGFGRRLVRKAIRTATPRSVRRAMHPVRTVKHAVTPKPIKKISRAAYTIRNPLGAAENKLINAAFASGRPHRHPARSRGGSTRQASTPRPYTPPMRVPTSAPSASGTRAVEAVASQQRIAQLMAVQRERFAEPRRPIVPPPAPVNPTPFRNAEWARRKHEVPFWRISQRQQLRAEVDQTAHAQAAQAFAQLQAAQREQQTAADAWWQALCQGDQAVLTTALVAAFADNPAPVRVHTAAGDHAVLVVALPGPEVLPTKKAHVTPTGRLSSKAWTKTEFNAVYADLLGAHLLATIREAWVVGRPLTHLRVIGIRHSQAAPDILFDIDVDRAHGQWNDDNWGSVLLRRQNWGLHRTGRTVEVLPWAITALRPDIAAIVPTAGAASAT